MTANARPISSAKGAQKSSETPRAIPGNPQSFGLAAASRETGETGVWTPRETGIGSGQDHPSPGAPPGLGTHAPLPLRATRTRSQGSDIPSRSRNESAWDEGTIYGRLAQADTSNDRDNLYCDRAAQAIRDFDKKF